MLDLIQAHRSTIVFTNSRRGAERLCARINELAAERAGIPAAGRRRGTPAEVMAQAGTADGAPPVVARAHHGSVSREERKHIEEALKSGQLPAVVATSSLELGIDMGAVDLVVQIEAPPSVAAGLQRIGRAGHQVGAVSRGVVFPKHRGDLRLLRGGGRADGRGRASRSCAIRATRSTCWPSRSSRWWRWSRGTSTSWPRWSAARRRSPSCPTRRCTRCSTCSPGATRRPRSPSCARAWSGTAATDVLTGRPGAQRLAVTSGGTIPDRGLFGVFLAGAERAARVGELDEEMVYESRVGDVFLLGSTSWRIEDITPDRVLVSPAPGAAARMPFWKGDALGRPVELGRAIGARLRGFTKAGDEQARAALTRAAWTSGPSTTCWPTCASSARRPGSCPTTAPSWSSGSATSWATGGLTVHCVLGARVNAPWALAIGRRLTERYGVDAQVMPSDDGIVVRLPDIADEPPGADLVAFDPDEIAAASWRSRSAPRRCSPPGSGSAPPGRCCCRAATRAAASRCGSSGSAPRSCSTSPASTPTSRSPWRPPGSACRTSSTCRVWSA